MIDSAAGFFAAVLALAGLFPVLATRWPQPFSVVPPIVWSYVATTLLALCGAWSQSPAIHGVQQAASARLMPALVFLLMVGCDLRAIVGLGPRALGAFACASGSILVGLAVAWVAWRGWLPAEGWQALGCLGGSWVGGTANLVATGQGISAAPAMVAAALLVDTICYAAWVTLLFATVPLAGRFDHWVRARPWDAPTAGARAPEAAATPGHVLCWLAAALAVGLTAGRLADSLPSDGPLTPGTWTLLFASLAGLVVAVTPLARLPGAAGVGSGLLAVAVVTLAAQGDVRGLDRVVWLVAAGFTALVVHALLMLAAARLWGFDLALCGIASLASIGGIASAPLLAAAHRHQLVPVAVLLALVGYLFGTWAGIGLATALSRFPGVTP
jgi:uncharacterized membrane protein